MPIGKNALKRVNNGYSNVASSAPDMENSEILKPEGKTVEKKPVTKSATSTTKTKTPSKKPAPKTPAKKPAVKPEAKKVEEKKADGTRPDGFIKTSLGDNLPVYLL